MTLSTGLVAYYPFTGNANCSISSANNGTVSGASLTTDKNSVSNQAYTFTRASSNYISVASGNSFESIGNTWSISIWVYPTATGNGYTGIAMQGNTTNFARFGISYDSSYRILVAGGTGASDTKVLATNSAMTSSAWNHIVVTHVDSGATCLVYKNGTLTDTITVPNPTPATDNPNFYIGRWIGGGGTANYFDGKLDELRVYNRVLSGAEVIELYEGYDAPVEPDINTGLKALYHFTGNGNDSSGNGNTLTVSGATLITDKNSVSNQAYDFDGVNDYLYKTTTTHLPSGASARTISFWAKINTLTADTYFMSYGEGVAGQFFSPRIDSSSKISFMGFSADYATTTTGTTTGWHHYCYVYDGTTLTIYYDGTSIGSSALTLNTTLVRQFVIGARDYNGSVTRYMDCIIDEVAIWGRTLSSTEITSLYNNYDTAFNTAPTNLGANDFGGL